MTTSHRAQLEARSGAKGASYIPTTTQHARLLPGHTNLKYRKPKKEKGEFSVSSNVKENKLNNSDKSLDEGDYGKEIVSRNMNGGHRGNNQESDDGEESGNDEEGSINDEEESDDDQEALLQELNKIRQERMVSKIRKEQLEENEGKHISAANVIPLRQTKGNWRDNTTFGRKKITKGGFQVQKKSGKPQNHYTNDVSNSEYHQDFLKRFIR